IAGSGQAQSSPEELPSFRELAGRSAIRRFSRRSGLPRRFDAENDVAAARVSGRIAYSQYEHVGTGLQRLGGEVERLGLAVEETVRGEGVDPFLAVDGERCCGEPH